MFEKFQRTVSGPVLKLGGAIVTVVQPVGSLLEIANTSTMRWAEEHAAEAEAKRIRSAAVRKQNHSDELRKVMVECNDRTLYVDDLVRKVQCKIDAGTLKQRVHDARRLAMQNISDEIIEQLARKENLTDMDIMRAAKVGSFANYLKESNQQDEDNTVVEETFDIAAFRPKPKAVN